MMKISAHSWRLSASVDSQPGMENSAGIYWKKKKKSCVSEPTQFKRMVFKGQPYLIMHSNALKNHSCMRLRNNIFLM